MAISGVRTAVIPVAGLGTRFLPVTTAVPKEMLPIVDRPCIAYIVAEAVAAGIERVVFVTSRGKDALVDYFDRNPALEAHLESTGKGEQLQAVREAARMAEVVCVRQGEALGLGHAVLTARPAVGDDSFAVLLGDDIIDAKKPAIQQLIEARTATEDAVVALLKVPMQDTRRYGVCAGPWLAPSRMQVKTMVEKPAPEDAPGPHAIVGRYVLPSEVFSILERTPRGAGGEVQLTDAIAELAAADRVSGLVFEGQRFDTGNVLGLLRASLHFTAKRPELRAGLKKILEEMEVT
jgi:UTP--glucose-1-phosphate uridylyltransferase